MTFTPLLSTDFAFKDKIAYSESLLFYIDYVAAEIVFKYFDVFFKLFFLLFFFSRALNDEFVPAEFCGD